MSILRFERLTKEHDRSRFDCGESLLNAYLAQMANQDQKRRAAAVFVMVDELQPKQVIGFYTLSATAVELTSLPVDMTKKLPKYPVVPAILIGRLARDLTVPGTGAMLLSDAIARSLRTSRDVAASLILVDSKNHLSTRFYSKFGFKPLPGHTDRLFLPMKSAEML